MRLIAVVVQDLSLFGEDLKNPSTKPFYCPTFRVALRVRLGELAPDL